MRSCTGAEFRCGGLDQPRRALSSRSPMRWRFFGQGGQCKPGQPEAVADAGAAAYGGGGHVSGHVWGTIA
jgi:hypothetical protein